MKLYKPKRPNTFRIKISKAGEPCATFVVEADSINASIDTLEQIVTENIKSPTIVRARRVTIQVREIVPNEKGGFTNGKSKAFSFYGSTVAETEKFIHEHITKEDEDN
jgi:hypothetical protein